MKKLSRSKEFIVTPNGQWEFPGQNTLIPSNQITMKGVPYPVFGMDDTGYSQMMYPGTEYTFPGNMVYEIPMMQKGGDKIPDYNSIYSEYSKIQQQINDYLKNNTGSEDEKNYRLKLNEIANNLVEQGVIIEQTDYVPESIKNWVGKDGQTANYCIGATCYVLNQAGDNLKYFDNTILQDDVIAGKVPGRTFDYGVKGIVPGDILQFKRSSKGAPYHAFLVQDISKPDEEGNRRVIAVGSYGHGRISNNEYILTKDNKIKSQWGDNHEVQTLRRPRLDENPVPNDLLKKRDALKADLEKYYPNYKRNKKLEEDIESEDPNVIYNYAPGTAFEWNKKNQITRGNPYSPTGRTINLEDSKINEILNVFSNPDYKQQFMAAQNVSPEEYDAIVKNVIGIYGQETKFGTAYGREPIWLQKFLAGRKGIKSVGPFQINPENLKTKRFSRKDLFDPIKGAEAAATFLSENLPLLRNRANAQPGEDIYSRNITPENYLEYLPYLMNDQNVIRRGDYGNIEKGYPIVQGKSDYKRNVDQYINALQLESIPISRSAPEYQSGGTFNPDTDEFIGFVDELPKAQTGTQVRKPKPIYADISTLAGKKRYEAYQDSSDLYNYDRLHKQLEPSFSTPQLMALSFGFNTSSDYANNQRRLLQEAQKIIKRNPRIKYGSPGSMFTATYNDYHLGNGIGNSPDLMMKNNSILPDGIWLGGAGNDDWSNVKPKQQVIAFDSRKKTTSNPKTAVTSSSSNTTKNNSKPKTTNKPKPKISSDNYSNTKKELTEPIPKPRIVLPELEYLQSIPFKGFESEEEPLKLNPIEMPRFPSKVLLREMGNINRYRNSIDGVIKEPYKNSHEVYMDDNKGWRKVSPDEYEMLKQQYPGADTEKGWIKNTKKAKGGLVRAQEGKENKLRRRNQSSEDDVLFGNPLKEFEVIDEAAGWGKIRQDAYKRRLNQQKAFQEKWYSGQEYDHSNIERRAGIYADDAAAKYILDNHTSRNDFANRQDYLRSFTPQEREVIARSNYAGNFDPDMGSRFRRGLGLLLGTRSALTNPDSDLSAEDYANRNFLSNIGDIISPVTYPLNVIKGAGTGTGKSALRGETANPWVDATDMALGNEEDVWKYNTEGDIIIDPLNFAGTGIGGLLYDDLGKVGNYLTTKTPLKETWRLNPWSFQRKVNELNPSEQFAYRTLGRQEGFENVSKSGYITPKPGGGYHTQHDIAFYNAGHPLYRYGEDFTIDPTKPGALISKSGPKYIAEVPLSNPKVNPRYIGREDKYRVTQGVDAGGLGHVGINEPGVTIYKEDWLRGYKPIKTPKQLSSSGNVAPIINTILTNDAVPILNTTDAPWSMKELPGLHIQSTLSGSPLEKQLSKTGQISRNSITAHINKAEVSAADKFTLQKVLNEKFPNQNKIDYNEFRKAVSDEAIELERKIVDNYQHNNWGLSALGYPGPKRSSYERAIENVKDEIIFLEGALKNKKSILGENNTPAHTLDLEQRISEAKDQLIKLSAEYEKMPLENRSITYSNVDKFGRGSADHFDESTLGHARTLVSSEEPDIMHFLEMQSDYWQKGGKQKEFNLEKYKEILAKRETSYIEDLETLKKLKETKMDYAGNPKTDWEIAQFEDIVKAKGEELKLRKGNIFNPEQKQFLGKNYLERLLQENVKYAAEQGKSSVRVPTSETAAKIQGYKPIETKLKKGDVIKLSDNKTGVLNNEVLWDDFISIKIDGKVEQISTEEFLKYNPKYSKLSFEPQHETILKKYSDQPKMIKKLFGAEPKVITDGKGNTWYEFDVPEKYKLGKAEIKAFSLGGSTIIGTGTIQEKKRKLKYKSGGSYNPNTDEFLGFID